MLDESPISHKLPPADAQPPTANSLSVFLVLVLGSLGGDEDNDYVQDNVQAVVQDDVQDDVEDYVPDD